MKIYTKTGDDGTTGLFNGSRVKKYDLRVETYGTIDELNSIIGLATSFAKNDLNNDLTILNNWLFNLGSDLATPLNPPPKFEVPRINQENINWLENKIDSYSDKLEELKSFILPGGCHQAAFLHQARTICRRAERLSVYLSESDDLGQFIVIFINRLSDYLFMAARYSNFLEGFDDIKWQK